MALSDRTSIPVESLEEWLAVWEAVSQYIDNSREAAEEDARVRVTFEAASALLERMDTAFARSAERLFEGRVSP